MKLRWLTLVVFAGFLVAADDSKEEAIKKDSKQLQGAWQAVNFERNGEKAPEDDVKNYKMTIDGDKYKFTAGGDTLSAGTLKLDPTSKPKSIEIVVTEGEHSGNTMKGIYEVDDDNHKICVAEPDKTKPTEFGSKADSGTIYIVFKRAK
jgi:uncharacterized protein (TIGR03067 family)